MKRSEIRYALFRCKAGTPDQTHLDILETYQSQLDELGLEVRDFTVEWDVHKTDLSEIVTGKIARKYNQPQSLFTGEGVLKE